MNQRPTRDVAKRENRFEPVLIGFFRPSPWYGTEWLVAAVARQPTPAMAATFELVKRNLIKNIVIVNEIT